ncbi:MAG: peptidoglycan-associated lipoprotein [Citromicrobium sp.]|uniref:peptidoglycan-associated lipoprotein Pal n=1 Tax=Citromicrobium bathyomarinum TaxID=72174 RepID=UPI000C3A8493|nr:peptidoglycan-associated lipoprotein [Citromicrobium sp.]MAO97011.1 peptidoglycan-associated lipoprotein [Citromicrobium sp.]MAS84382.1 peptidoglycan-associated lipoprotein [Erythrobacteraceae bacterium]MBD75774.1 peptidoglycan-associated lipoprotein [Citromicrobium sp.]MBT46039.1 peptidoglycan-associated lipoprotein [Citromicrobium sp.]|tara:strand:+ start:837 stop:1352 length:516 start_codon:yes stop_codon:yes gene_type:complete
MNSRIKIAIILAATASLAACKSNAPEELPPEPGVSQPTNPGDNSGPGYGVGSQEHFVNAVNGQNVIYFDTDRYNIDTADAAALQMQAQYLAQYPNISVTIEGHADERGTREYNLALGERRANSAKNYLVSLGIAANRIRTVSYGEERPVATASTPEAWAKNRRAVTVVINY